MKNILYQESIVEIKHLFRMMRNTLLALFVFAGTAFATESYSQTMKVTVVADNMSTGKVISEIEKQTDYLFVYNVNEVNLKRNVKVNAQNKSVAEVLNKVFEGTDIYYAMEGKNIMLMSKAKDGEVAQQANKVTGIVKDTNGEPIIGANVTVKGQSIGTITDIDGRFVLDAPKNAVLQITYIGYVSQEVKVSGNKELNIILKEDTETLDEVVVVGYGTMKKTDLTGAVMQVKTNDIKSVTAGNPLQALQGRAPGVSVMTNNIPGESPTMRIRGSGSISAGNDPLYVVDGFPLMNGSISEVNANDIASIEVLKDASATAIYGSRGANGVVMITTKTGAKNAKNLSFNATYGFQMPGRLIETMNHEQFVDFINTAYTNAKGTPVYTAANPAPDIHTDWQDEIIKDSAPVQDYSISFDGTTGDTQYMVSGGMFLQNGLISSAKFDKYTFRSNIQHKFNRFLTIGSHLQYAYTEQAKAGIGNTAGSLSSIWRSGWPTLPVKNEDGSFAIPADNPAIAGFFSDDARWNPIANYGEVTNTRTTSRLFGDVYAELKITKDLTFKTNFGIDIANVRNYNYGSSKQTTATGSGNGGNGYIKELSRITENILTYTKNWDEHRFSATGVYSWQDYVYENLSISGKGFQNDETGAWDMGLADRETMSYASGKYGNTLISFTGRFTYAYKDRYLMTATARYDGSSRFLADKRWAWFPSVSLGWNIAREEFFEKLSETVNTLKLRGSWGQLGNTSSNYNSFWDWYPFYQQQAISSASSNWLINGEKQNTSSLPSIVNATMTWETVETWDFGFDFGAFNNRLTGTFDWYSRTTKDMIGPAPILGSVLGTNAPKTNNCDMRTSGWELEIGWRDQINDFKYGVRFNLSDNRSKILTYPYDGEFSNQSIGGYYNGKYLNEIWGYESVGLASSKVEMDNWLTTNKPNWGSNWGAGDVMYKDLNGDGIVSSGANTLDDHGDLKRIGNATPRYRIGLNLDAAYKGFDFSIFFQGVLKRDWFFGAGDAYFWGAQGNMWQSACFEDHLDYWTENNTGAYYPKPYFGGIQKNQQTQTRYLQSAAYLRCKNIQLGYTLPKSLLSPAGISNCRIYLSCDNLFTITSLSDIFDPEAFGGYGDEGWGSGKTYPLQRTVSVGVNLSF